jgi:hypothetical protein
MKLWSAGVVGILLCVAGCGQPAQDAVPQQQDTRQTTPILGPQHGSQQGPAALTARERSLATTLAVRQERKVTGTFIGATAFATQGTPFDQGSACDLDKRFINIRLVWKSDANFVHADTPYSPPDGPRKALVLTVDPTNGHVCETGASYQNVGADESETFLYGQWPDPADG